MAIETREKIIGGTRYRVTQFGAKQGRTVLVQLTKLVGPALSAGLTSLGSSDTKGRDYEAAIAAALGQALYDLSERLDEKQVSALLDDLAKFTVIVIGENEPRLDNVFDDHFAGRYDELVAWAAFALEVNYRSFFDGKAGGGLLSRLSCLMRSASTSPTRSSNAGTSTGSPAADGTARA